MEINKLLLLHLVGSSILLYLQGKISAKYLSVLNKALLTPTGDNWFFSPHSSAALLWKEHKPVTVKYEAVWTPVKSQNYREKGMYVLRE